MVCFKNMDIKRYNLPNTTPETKIHTREESSPQSLEDLVRLNERGDNLFLLKMYTKLKRAGYKTTKEVADAIHQGKIRNEWFLETLVEPRDVPLSTDIVTAARDALKPNFKPETSTITSPKIIFENETQSKESVLIQLNQKEVLDSLLQKKRTDLLNLLDSKEPTPEHLAHVMDQALITIDKSRGYAPEKMTFLFGIGFELRDDYNLNKKKVKNFINKISY